MISRLGTVQRRTHNVKPATQGQRERGPILRRSSLSFLSRRTRVGSPRGGAGAVILSHARTLPPGGVRLRTPDACLTKDVRRSSKHGPTPADARQREHHRRRRRRRVCECAATSRRRWRRPAPPLQFPRLPGAHGFSGGVFINILCPSRVPGTTGANTLVTPRHLGRRVPRPGRRMRRACTCTWLQCGQTDVERVARPGRRMLRVCAVHE